jgi:hypothetical protein
MEAIVWIEVLSRARDVSARHRCAGPEIRVGRAYDNDVVLDDPYVAPHHLLIRRSESGGWIAEDLGTANGLFVDQSRDRFGWVEIDGNRLMRIGHTYLRLRESDYAVAPERTEQARSRPLWPALAGLGVAVVAIDLGSSWIAETTEPKLSPYLFSVLTVAVLLGGWTAIWSVLARIFSGQARFERNLLIALVGMVIYGLYREFAEFAGFALAWGKLAPYQYIGVWSLLAAICFLHLRVVSPARLKLKAGLVIALLAAGIGVQLLNQSELRTGFDRQGMALHLLPPEFRLVPLQTEDTFFADIEALKAKLDHDRTEPQPSLPLLGGPIANGKQ